MTDYTILSLLSSSGNQIISHSDSNLFYFKENEEDWTNNPYSNFMFLTNNILVNSNGIRGYSGVLISLIFGKYIEISENNISVSDVPIQYFLSIDDSRIYIGEKYLIYNIVPLGNRIWWNFHEMNNLIAISNAELGNELFKFSKTIYDQFAGGLEFLVYSNTGFTIRYPTEEEFNALINVLLQDGAVIRRGSEENVIWSRCNPNDIPKVLISIGPPGVGKSYSNKFIAQITNMVDPISISYDDPLLFFQDTRTLSNLTLGKYKVGLFGVKELLYPIAGLVEDKIWELSNKNRIDTIIEKGNWDPENIQFLIQNYKTLGYQVLFSYKIINNKIRLNNMQERFNRIGRYSNPKNNFDDQREDIFNLVLSLGMSRVFVDDDMGLVIYTT